MKIITVTFAIFLCFKVLAFPIPKNGEAKFDIIRKNKIIGSHEISFSENGEVLLVETNINVKVKALFIPVYKYNHQSTETWINGDFVKIDAYTDFEDEREYFITGYQDDQIFYAQGMDGELKLNKDIIPSNFWNINVLNQKEIFDTQKGIVRDIEVEDLGYEKIEINNEIIKCKKFTLNASDNPKDKGPFPEYTLWYNENNELMKLKFINWKDKKVVTTIRSNPEKD